MRCKEIHSLHLIFRSRHLIFQSIYCIFPGLHLFIDIYSPQSLPPWPRCLMACNSALFCDSNRAAHQRITKQRVPASTEKIVHYWYRLWSAGQHELRRCTAKKWGTDWDTARQQIETQSEALHSNLRLQSGQPMKFFWPKCRLGHPENYLFFLTFFFLESKYPKKVLL